MTNRRDALKTIGMLIPAASLLDHPLRAKASADLTSHFDDVPWIKIRKEFMLSKDSVFLNSGTIGAMPRRVFERYTAHVKKTAVDIADWDYTPEDMSWISGYDPMLTLRQKIAAFLGGKAEEIALTDNVTCGISYLANGIDLNAGDVVAISDQEHTGGKSPWFLQQKRKNIHVIQIPLPKPVQSKDQILDAIESKLQSGVKVLMISHIISGSGAILPVAEICSMARSKGVLTIIDGAQAVGQIKVDVRKIGCDAYVGCFHKWVGAPPGSGFLWARGDFFKNVWGTVASTEWDNLGDNGYRISQRGTGSYSILEGVDEALTLFNEIGSDRIFQRIRQLGDHLRSGLAAIPGIKFFSPADPAMCAGMTVFKLNGLTGPFMQEKFWTLGRMRPRSAGDEFGVRCCTHIYNSMDELDRFVELAKKMASS